MCPYYRSPVYLILSIMWYCVGIVSGSVFGRGPPASTSLTAAAATQSAMSQGLHTRVSPRHPLLQHLPLLMLITCNKHGCRPTLRYTWPCTPRCLCCHLTCKLVQVDAFYYADDTSHLTSAVGAGSASQGYHLDGLHQHQHILAVGPRVSWPFYLHRAVSSVVQIAWVFRGAEAL